MKALNAGPYKWSTIVENQMVIHDHTIGDEVESKVKKWAL